MDILLIHPPVVKPSEPPTGIARLAGALRDHGRSYEAIDANIEGLLYLLKGKSSDGDTWTRRAFRHREDNLASLRNGRAFRSVDSYIRAVTEINRILECSAEPFGTHLSLGNFAQHSYSPVKSSDLIRATRNPEGNVFYPYFRDRLGSFLSRHAPHTIGFSLNYLSQAVTTFAMIGFIRRESSDVRIVLGGGLVTSWMRGPRWDNPFAGLVDHLVAGPGEEFVVNLSGGQYSGNDPLPEYSPSRTNSYLSPCPVIPLSTSQGCYWAKCSFCPEQAEGNRYCSLPPDRAIRDLEALAEKESSCLVHVCDNAMSPGFMNAMASRESSVPWYGFARVTHHLTDPDFCTALKRSGCVMLKLGLESGDQEVLDSLGKGIRLEDSAKALKAIHDSGIATYVYLLFGTPSEDETSARRTLAFISRHSGHIDFLNLSIFNLPRGSREAQGLETYDFSDGDLSLYQGFVHARGWNRNRVRQFLDKEFKRHSAVARIIRSDPPSFTSNHAPFFAMNRIP